MEQFNLVIARYNKCRELKKENIWKKGRKRAAGKQYAA